MDLQWEHTKSVLLSLKDKIKCSICNELPDDPHMLWCKHSFCKDCIVKQSHCPECNYPMNIPDLVRNIMLSHLLDAIKVSSEVVSSNEAVINENTIAEDKENKQSDCLNKLITVKNVTNDEILSLKNTRRGHENVKNSNKINSSTSLKAVNVDSKINNKPVEKQNQPTCSASKSPNNGNNISILEKSAFSTPKVNAKRSLYSSDKTSDKELNKSLKSQCGDSLESSIKCLKEGFKTPRAKRKAPIKTTTTKSLILYSAKKVQQVNKVNEKGETPLQIACRQGKLDLVRKLLGEGAEPNVKDYASWTPLCDGVGSRNVEVVKALLEAGAWVNTPSNLNTTALVEAVVLKDAPIVRLLLSYGADIHQRTALDNTALSIADDEMRDVLMKSFVGEPTKPAPTVKLLARTILAADLSPQHTEQLMALCQTLNLTLSTSFTEDVSHVVVEKTGDVCHGSVDVMLGILSGCSVVGTDWVTACLAQGDLLPPDDYEPVGTDDHPNSQVFCRARRNKELLLPRLFDGCHISLQHDQPWPKDHKPDVIALIQAAGAVYQPRQCDAERIPLSEQTVMYHASTESPLALVSHIILYQPGPSEPLLKYNMAHVKSLSVSWFVDRVKTFTMSC